MNSLPSLCSPGSLPEDELAFMTPNMEEDIDFTMRAPYISMSEASELPLLIAEDLMWGAQPDLKQTLCVNSRKAEVNPNNTITMDPLLLDEKSRQINGSTQQIEQTAQKSTLESSLATLLCNQILQSQQREGQVHHQQQQQQQILINPTQQIKIKIGHGGNFEIVNSTGSSPSQSSSSIASPPESMLCDGELMNINRF